MYLCACFTGEGFAGGARVLQLPLGLLQRAGVAVDDGAGNLHQAAVPLSGQIPDLSCASELLNPPALLCTLSACLHGEFYLFSLSFFTPSFLFTFFRHFLHHSLFFFSSFFYFLVMAFLIPYSIVHYYIRS